MSKKVIRTFFDAPDPAHVRARLRHIDRCRDRSSGGASMPRVSRLFFNSLLKRCRAAAANPAGTFGLVRGPGAAVAWRPDDNGER